MSDYARLQEENLTLKAQLAAGVTTATAKSSTDAALQAKCDRYEAALRDIADGGESKSDMKELAAKAIAGK